MHRKTGRNAADALGLKLGPKRVLAFDWVKGLHLRMGLQDLHQGRESIAQAQPFVIDQPDRRKERGNHIAANAPANHKSDQILHPALGMRGVKTVDDQHEIKQKQPKVIG